MRLAPTQDKTDGELYWIIENGIRLTGMPAWGTGGPDDVDTWKLVHFIRRLNELTPEQLKAMAAPTRNRRLNSRKRRPTSGSWPARTSPSPVPHHH